MIYKTNYTFIMSDKLPEGSSGDYSIVKGTLEKGNLLRTYSPFGSFYIDKLGSSMPVVKLLKNGDAVMSDTPMEQEGLRIPSFIARGDILIIGLGIGLLPTLIRMRNQTVKSMLIVEENEDVVKLVYPFIKNRRTDLRVCDGEKYLMACKDKFDFIFIDVWSAITTTIKEIDKWTELAKPLLNEKGEVKCWLQELYDRIKNKLPKEPIELTGLSAVREPCLICGKKLRNDYAGLCCDCADYMEVSELFMRR